MTHDKRARFLGRRAHVELEGEEEANEWELGSAVSRSTWSSAGSSTSASSRSDSSSEGETVDDGGTEMGGSSDGEEAYSNHSSMEVDTVGWNEDAETPAAETGNWEKTPVLSHAAFGTATAVEASHHKSLEPARPGIEHLNPPNTSNFAITITPSPSPDPPIVLSLSKPSASEPVAILSPRVSPSVSSALSPSVSSVTSVRSGLVERPRTLPMAGSLKILKRSLSAISIGQPQPKAAETGTEKHILNEDVEKTRRGARGSTSQNTLEGDEDAKSQHSEKRAEVVTPTPTQTGSLPTEPSQIGQPSTIPLARLTALSPMEPTRKEASLTENPDSTPGAAAKEASVIPTSPQRVGEISMPITPSASTIPKQTAAVPDADEGLHGAFADLWDDLAILVREMQELSIAIEQGAEAGRLKKTEASGAQVGESFSVQQVQEVQVVVDAINSPPAMNEVREVPITLVNLEAASPSVGRNPAVILRDSSRSAELTKGIAEVDGSLTIVVEPASQRFWKDEHIGQWVASSAIPSEKTRTSLLTRK